MILGSIKISPQIAPKTEGRLAMTLPRVPTGIRSAVQILDIRMIVKLIRIHDGHRVPAVDHFGTLAVVNGRRNGGDNNVEMDMDQLASIKMKISFVKYRITGTTGVSMLFTKKEEDGFQRGCQEILPALKHHVQRSPSIHLLQRPVIRPKKETEA